MAQALHYFCVGNEYHLLLPWSFIAGYGILRIIANHLEAEQLQMD